MANPKKTFKGFSSAAVHAGHFPDPRYSHLTPIYASSTFTFDTAEQGMMRFEEKEQGYIYTRWGNPNFTEAEEKICALEGFGLNDENKQALKLKALLHASGQAAMTTMFLANLKAGDKVLSHYSLYGGTHELLHKILPPLGVEPVIVDLRDLQKTANALKSDPAIKWIHLETPANPTIQCVDIRAISDLAKERGIPVSVDNTFATPYLQQPFALGADYVFHSTTKYLNGHGTAIGGVLIGKDPDTMNGRILKCYRLLGGNANPFDAYMLINGLKTLELRMERHCANAKAVAEFLQSHKAVSKVNYTGLPSHPDYELASRQMKQAGPVLSVELKGGMDAGKQFIDRLQLCTRAVSLGTTDTLISHPASMTHYGVPKAAREEAGITDGLIRMSVGIENIEDILEDLDQALDRL
ncbi:MAG TPA: aminotransferase class I/II-fold pyridoxal phosphate-dependent enzyme [Parasegetibacter sp.]